MSTVVKVWITILMLALTAYGGYTAYRVYCASSLEQTAQPAVGQPQAVTWADVSKVTLIERSGEPLSLKQFEGKVWVVNFFFASCPGSCKKISANLSELHKELADKDITFVSISVDPETDTPAVLSEYAKIYGADAKRWLFLTGDFEVIRGLCSDIFKMPIERKTHADRLVLVDRDGQIAGTYNSNYPEHMVDMKRKIDKLLAARPGESAKTETSAAKEPDGS